MAWPRWWTWHQSVPVWGPRSVDQRQPGSHRARATFSSSSVTMSTWARDSVLVSSGWEKRFAWSLGTVDVPHGQGRQALQISSKWWAILDSNQ